MHIPIFFIAKHVLYKKLKVKRRQVSLTYTLLNYYDNFCI